MLHTKLISRIAGHEMSVHASCIRIHHRTMTKAKATKSGFLAGKCRFKGTYDLRGFEVENWVVTL